MESIRLTPFFLALLLAGSLVIAVNAQTTTTASPSVTGAESPEIVTSPGDEGQEEIDRDLRRRAAVLQQSQTRRRSNDASVQSAPPADDEDEERDLRSGLLAETGPVKPRISSAPNLPTAGRGGIRSLQFSNGPAQLPNRRPNIRDRNRPGNRPGNRQPVCCIYCRSNDYNCLSNCVGDCRQQDQCEDAGRGAYRAFCEENCPRTGAARYSSSPLVPIQACRGLCKKQVQQLCVASGCRDVVPGCFMSNCASAAPRKCG